MRIMLVLFSALLLVACSAPAAGDVVVSTNYVCDETTGQCNLVAQLYETPTPEPPLPTYTPQPPLPTYTPEPTYTPLPPTMTPQPTPTVLPFYAQVELGPDFQVYMGPESVPTWSQVYGVPVTFVEDTGIRATMLFTSTGVYQFDAVWLRNGQPMTATMGVRINDPGLPLWTVFTDELGVTLPTVTPVP